jgi:5-(carboxyamino)imidazole ribonucleotide mutase
MNSPFVSIIMGSDSDLPKVSVATDILKKFNIKFEVKIHSAHRTPEATHNYVHSAVDRGVAVFIACAGMAAHLAGVVASLTVKPVIGVPIDSGALNGIDALLSTSQMPAGIPVATMAIGKAGATNAGYLAAQIIASTDEAIYNMLLEDRKQQAQQVIAKDANLQNNLTNS